MTRLSIQLRIFVNPSTDNNGRTDRRATRCPTRNYLGGVALTSRWIGGAGAGNGRRGMAVRAKSWLLATRMRAIASGFGCLGISIRSTGSAKLYYLGSLTPSLCALVVSPTSGLGASISGVSNLYAITPQARATAARLSSVTPVLALRMRLTVP